MSDVVISPKVSGIKTCFKLTFINSKDSTRKQVKILRAPVIRKEDLQW